MNRCVEFHDSAVRSVDACGGSMQIVLDPAYVHVSPGQPGIDAREGHLQVVMISFEGAALESALPEYVGALSDGEVIVNGVTYSLVPLPFQASGEISAAFVFCDGTTLNVTAKSVSCSASGLSRFVETYAA